MSKLFAFPILSKYPERLIDRFGLFGKFSFEIVILIFQYVIKRSSLRSIVCVMNTCNFFRSLIRDFLSTTVQEQVAPMTFAKYKLLSKIIHYNHDHLDLSYDFSFKEP